MSVILSLCNKVKIYKKNFLVVKRLNNSFKQKKMSISYKLRELASSHSFVCLFFNMSGYLFNFLDVQVSFFLQIENDLAITDYNFIFPCKNLTYI